MASVNTSIEWTDATWSPVRGCSIVSKGCTNCYAMKQAHRFSGPGRAYEGLTKLTNGGPVWTGKVQLVPELLAAPLHWRKPRRVFVNSMSDLFHEDVPDEFIDQVFAVMALCPQHTFQVLTKRAERMRRYLTATKVLIEIDSVSMLMLSKQTEQTVVNLPRRDWPLPNVWLGVSCEDQATADERIPVLLDTPAAVRFVSAEPLLAPVDLTPLLQIGTRGGDGIVRPDLSWLIVGGESGPGARPCDVAWIRSIVAQCKAAGTAFVKQLGARPIWNGCAGPDEHWPAGTARVDSGHGYWDVRLRDRKGGDPSEWPADLRVREFPC